MELTFGVVAVADSVPDFCLNEKGTPFTLCMDLTFGVAAAAVDFIPEFCLNEKGTPFTLCMDLTFGVAAEAASVPDFCWNEKGTPLSLCKDLLLNDLLEVEESVKNVSSIELLSDLLVRVEGARFD